MSAAASSRDHEGWRATLLDWFTLTARDLPWRRRGAPRRLGGPGQRGDAAADAGRPGAAGVRGVAAPLADPGRAGRRARRRGGAGMGAAGLPAPGAAPARSAHARASSGTAARCPATSTALRALPGVGAYTAAAVASFAYGGGTPSWTRTCAGCWPGWSTAGASRRARRRPSRSSAAAADLLPGGPGYGRRVERRADGARRAASARPGHPRCAACPFGRACAWRLAGRPAGAGAPTRRAQRVRRHRPAGARAAARRAARSAAAPVRQRPSWTRSGRTRSSAPGRWTRSSPTASSEPLPRRPLPPPPPAPADDRAVDDDSNVGRSWGLTGSGGLGRPRRRSSGAGAGGLHRRRVRQRGLVRAGEVNSETGRPVRSRSASTTTSWPGRSSPNRIFSERGPRSRAGWCGAAAGRPGRGRSPSWPAAPWRDA